MRVDVRESVESWVGVGVFILVSVFVRVAVSSIVADTVTDGVGGDAVIENEYVSVKVGDSIVSVTGNEMVTVLSRERDQVPVISGVDVSVRVTSNDSVNVSDTFGLVMVLLSDSTCVCVRVADTLVVLVYVIDGKETVSVSVRDASRVSVANVGLRVLVMELLNVLLAVGKRVGDPVFVALASCVGESVREISLVVVKDRDMPSVAVIEVLPVGASEMVMELEGVGGGVRVSDRDRDAEPVSLLSTVGVTLREAVALCVSVLDAVIAFVRVRDNVSSSV